MWIFFPTVTCKTSPALCCLQKTWHRHVSPLSPPVSPLGWEWEGLRSRGGFGVHREGSGTTSHLFHGQSHATLSKNRKEKKPSPRLLTPQQNRWFKITSAREGERKNPPLLGDFVHIFTAKLSGNAAKYTPFSLSHSLLYN